MIAGVLWFWQPWVPDSPATVEQALRTKNYPAALAGAERLARQDPRQPRLWMLLARARMASKDLNGMIDALRKIPEVSILKPEALFFEGKALIELHRGREAEKAFLQCVQKSPPDSALLVNAEIELLAIYAMEERWDAFREMSWQIYPQVEGAEALSVLTMRMRGEFEQTKPEMSIELLTKYVEMDPEDANAFAGLAAAYEQQGNLGEAVQHYRKAHQADLANLEIEERYLSSLLKNGDSDILRSEIQALSTAAHERSGILKIEAILDQNDGRFLQAAEKLQLYLAGRPDDSEAVHRLSQVMLRLGRKEDAEAWTEKRNRLNKGRDSLRDAWNDFADQYEKTPEEIPPVLLEKLGEACKEAQLNREARAWLNLALQFRNSRENTDNRTSSPGP